MIKLLIVDDSGFMRVAIRKMVEADARIQVVGEARNGAIALSMVESLQPNVITMDIEMPEMDGLEAIRRIMASQPRPIIVLSSLTQAGAPTTLKALELGAVDFISKASSFVQLDIVHIQNELLEKIRYWGHRVAPPVGAAAANPTISRRPPPASGGRRAAPRGKVDMVAVGVSTGGPRMLPVMLQHVGKLHCPVVVAQHMPAAFTPSFADHLQTQTGLRVVEGKDGAKLENGIVVILPGGTDAVVRAAPFQGFTLRIQHQPGLTVHPSVDLLFRSVAATARQAVGVILTGMGRDGCDSAGEMAAKGWPVLAQTPSTCVVDGMPGEVIAAGHASDVLSLEEIGRRLTLWAGQG